MSLQIACSKSRQQEIDKIQNHALRIVSGGMRSTPIAATEVLTNTEPLAMRREKAAIETFERCKRMPPKHPARELVDHWKPKDRIKHQSIMHHIVKLKEKVNLPDDRAPLRKTCSIPPNAQPGCPEIKTSLKGNVTKKSDIIELKKAAELTILEYPEDWTHSYTDGSAIKAVARAGLGVWIMYPDGSSDQVSEACGEICSNYEAENLAIQKALEHMDKRFTESPSSATNVVIFTDSKSMLQSMEGKDLDEDLDEETLQVLIKADRLKTTHDIQLTMQWIPGHTDLFGNEQADKLAKQGSLKPQPTKQTTLNTAKQMTKQTYKQEWMKNWENGTTGRIVYENMKTPKLKDETEQLKRKDQTAIFRLRTQHVPFNYHLNRFKPTIPPLCDLCNYPYKTVEHVLFQCRELQDLRQKYLPSYCNISNSLYGSLKQLERTATFFHMACARRANAQRPLD